MAYMNMGEGINGSVLGTNGSACQWSMRQNSLYSYLLPHMIMG